MLDEFLTVGQQVLILFIIIAVGYIFGKTKVFSEIGAKNMTDFVLYIVCPCVVINAFQREYDPSEITNLAITAGLALLAHIIPTVLAYLLIHDENEKRERVLRFGAVFSNCGFMSLPLQQALLGADGVFYGAVFVAIFNLCVWSYGLIMMSGDKSQLSPKKIITNPGIIGVCIGMVLFFTQFTLPTVVKEPVGYFAALNTPLPMVIIGYHLSNVNILKALKDAKMYMSIAIRLIIAPLVLMGIMYLLKVDNTILVACVIAEAAPMAAITTMFSAKYDKATGLSVDLVSISTILSLITLPLVISLAQSIG